MFVSNRKMLWKNTKYGSHIHIVYCGVFWSVCVCVCISVSMFLILPDYGKVTYTRKLYETNDFRFEKKKKRNEKSVENGIYNNKSNKIDVNFTLCG